MTRATLVLRATQQTALTPRLQQSVRLLQLSSNDFAQELEQALATNPFLEVASTSQSAEPGAEEAAWTAALSGRSDPATNFVESVVADASIAVENGVALLDQRSSNVEQLDSVAMPTHDHDDGADFHDGGYASAEHGPSSDRSSRDDIDVGSWAEAASTLRMHLHAELAGCRIGAREREIAELVIEAVDDDGYLRQELADVAAHFDFDPPVDADELAVALERVQQLGPPGIAARGVGECLALQLDALAALPSRLKAGLDAACLPVARAMVDAHLERVAARDWTTIRRLLGCPLQVVMEAAELIRSLDPRPGSTFGGDVALAVVPDVIVRRVRNGWHTDINPAVIPRLALNRVYAALFHEARGGDRQPLGQQLQEARWLLRNAAQRFVTIRRVARAIVAEQSAFFDYGDIAIRPLLLRQVADQLELHESTISRAIGNKFMATPRGVFAFKHFFSRKLDTVSGGTCSAASIRAAMRELLDREDHDDPMSDVVLARRLTEQGLCVARRTVTKYRGLMRIPPVEMRRRA